MIINNIQMSTQISNYPQNLPYVNGVTSTRPSRTQTNEETEINSPMSPAFLLSRVQYLQEQLSSLASVLSQEGSFQQVHAHLQRENEQLRSVLTQQQALASRAQELQSSNELLRENLLKQNEEMEELYRQLQQTRVSNSRMQERGHTQQLQDKVLQLNDEISNLLVKIQQLVEENNDQQNSKEEYSRQLDALSQRAEEAERYHQQLLDQNAYLKEQIRQVEDMSMGQQKEMQNKYLMEISQNNQLIEELKNNLQKLQAKPGQIRANSDRNCEEKPFLQQQIIAIRAELLTKNQELIEESEAGTAMRKKWEQRIIKSQEQIADLTSQVTRLKSKLRLAESSNDELAFSIEQHQKERERLAFYKNSYADSQQLRATITRLQAERQESALRVAKMQMQLSSSRAELNGNYIVDVQHVHKFEHDQIEQELMMSKATVKDLRQMVSRYEEDYKRLREDFQLLLNEKQQVERVVTCNQNELNRHKQAYDQFMTKYNRTAAEYQQLQRKISILQGEKAKASHNKHNYNKEDSVLIKLENSALKQEIASLERQLSNTSKSSIAIDHKQLLALKGKEKDILREVQAYRQKYLSQLQKNTQNQELERAKNELQQKLTRVNKVLNQTVNQLDQCKEREQLLALQLENSYKLHKQQFNIYGIKHHPEVKKLQNELLLSQRHLMENDHHFKQKIVSLEDQISQLRLQNQHHRAKIDQLIKEVNKQRNSLDYNKLMRSLELAELKKKQLERELAHKDSLIGQLRQLCKQHTKDNKNSIETHEESKENNKYHQLHDLETKSIIARRNDTRSRAEGLEGYITNTGRSEQAQSQKGSFITSENKHCRYQQLVKQKAQIRKQFEASQRYLIQGENIQERRQILKGGRSNNIP